LNRPFSRHQQAQPLHRINGKIRARDVRVIGHDGQQVGVIDLAAAINLARQAGVDLVEIAPNAVPPVCRIIDYGKFKYELSKKERDSKKHQHTNTVKEVQLSPRIDPHDLGIKLEHAIGFLCEDMKVKATLRFRGREMAHTEIGKEVMEKFLEKLSPWGHPDFPPKLIGRAINVMVSPLAKNKRAKNPKEGVVPPPEAPKGPVATPASTKVSTNAAESKGSLGPSPFEGLSVPTAEPAPESAPAPASTPPTEA
jgi:translation initiation factor IF-3